MTGQFQVDPKLAADTAVITDLPLCRALLMNDHRFPWAILVPRRPGVREIHGLIKAERLQLVEEAAATARAMEKQFSAHKMNVAALGNIVPQLHVHVIARFPEDAAWPGPVWGVGTPEPYGDRLEQMLGRMRKMLSTVKPVA